MKKRDQNILDAATQVFLRYGVKRASMSDIAAEAGVARQTVYNAYANKNEILRGSIRAFGEDAMVTLEAELPQAATLSDKLDLVLSEMVLKPYAFLHFSPNALDLLEGYNDAGRDEIEANYLLFEEVLTELFSPYASALLHNGLTPQSLAETVRRAASAFKNQARDLDHVTRLVESLRNMALSTTAGSVALRPTPDAAAVTL